MVTKEMLKNALTQLGVEKGMVVILSPRDVS